MVLVVSYNVFILMWFFQFQSTERQIIVKDRIIVGARTRRTLGDVQFRVFIFVSYFFGSGMSEVLYHQHVLKRPFSAFDYRVVSFHNT